MEKYQNTEFMVAEGGCEPSTYPDIRNSMLVLNYRALKSLLQNLFKKYDQSKVYWPSPVIRMLVKGSVAPSHDI